MGSAITRKGQRKLNPINVQDPETKNNLELADGNFKTLFGQVNAPRFFVSPGIVGTKNFQDTNLITPPELEVVATVSGGKPVMVGLMPKGLAAYNVGSPSASYDASTAGYSIYTDVTPAFAIRAQFYLLADGQSFWGVVKGWQGRETVTFQRLEYFGAPFEISGIHVPINPGQVKYSLSMRNSNLTLQTIQISSLALFAVELF